jgi:thiamine-monophosphate kinase
MREGALHPIVAPLREAGEFDLVRAIAAALGDRAAELGDDAAVFPLPHGDSPVVSVDASVEGVHFRREWLEPREIGYRAAAAAMSDLAAMAAAPRALLLALTLPPDRTGDVAAIADGVGELTASVGALVVGGNLAVATELSLTTTVIGSVRTPLRRTGLQPGDRLYVTGRLGGAGAALADLLAGRTPSPERRQRFARPEPRIREAQWLAAAGAVAAIDISDGLLADLENLAAASGVAIRLDARRIPCFPGVSAEEALTSGEEYELIVGARDGFDAAAFEARFGIALTEVASVGQGSTGVVVEGIARVAKAHGHDHFSR